MFKGLKGTVRARGNSWQVLYPYKDEDGEYKKRIKTCKTQTEALQVLRMFNQEHHDGVSMQDVTMKKVYDSWIREKELSASSNSIDAYKNAGMNIVNYFKKSAKRITRDDVVKYFAHLKEMGLEVKYPKTVLSMMMNHAVKMRYIPTNPVIGVKASRTKKERPPKVIPMKERKELLTAFSGTIYYYWLAIDFITGMRKGELCGLKWENVDLERKEIKVCEQYTVHGQTERLKSKHSYRTINIGDAEVKLFNEIRQSEFSDSVFVFRNRASLYKNLLYHLGKYDIVPHDIRHSHATDLLGILNHADAAYRMGHTVEEYIRTYVHSMEDNQKNSAELISELNKNMFL